MSAVWVNQLTMFKKCLYFKMTVTIPVGQRQPQPSYWTFVLTTTATEHVDVAADTLVVPVITV